MDFSTLSFSQLLPPNTSKTSARYWRVYITAVGASAPNVLIQGGSSWQEVVGTNLTVTIATASSTATGQDAINAWNSDTTKAWQSTSGSVPAWNAVDFGSARQITRLLYQGPASSFTNRAATAFQVQWSNDNSTWNTLATYSGLTWGNNELKTFTVQ